ncbi:MAG: O-antigen ligase family protein [Burkholderiales bacterium]|nr:O-antigen ligase family protein [Burkholderiales bacterium]
MPPTLASIVAALAIAYGFWLDRRRNPEVSPALWIPLAWFLLISTRFFSQWLGGSLSYDSPDALLEGSPLDQAIFLALYAAAVATLVKRRLSVRAMLSANPWLVAFFAYCLASVIWSDFPWTAFKRLVKVSEHVAMVMVVLTERNRAQAIDALFRRFAYVTVIVSVLFIKYYPHLGRAFDAWTGAPINRGITLDKNALGHICVIVGAFLVSTLVARGRPAHVTLPGTAVLFDYAVLVGIVWLISIANAKTALLCFAFAIVIVVALARTRLGAHPRLLVALMGFGLLVAFALEALLDIREWAILALNRDTTLTDRTAVWADVLAMPINPLIGTGFESFWLGDRADTLWRKYWWRPNQAHNGLIEIYINLGAIGVILMAGTILAGFAKALRSLPMDPGFARLRLAFLAAILLFNYTDATFKALNALFFLYFLVVTSYPRRRASRLVPQPPPSTTQRSARVGQ